MATFCSFAVLGAIFFLSCGLHSVNSATVNKAEEKAVLCYFGSWATYRWGIATFEVSNIDASLCSHLVYAYTGLKNGVIASLDEYNDYEENWGKGTMKKFVNFAKTNNVKALVGIGGWNEGSLKYSQMASTEAGREAFANSVVAFIHKFGFNGLELDWQYPTMYGGSASDKGNYVLLLKKLSEKFEAENLILSVGVGGAPSIVTAAYNHAEIGKYADFIVVLSFDYHTYTDGVTAVSAPLEATDDLSVDDSVQLWLEGGAPANKLIIGVPMYGRTDHLADPNKHGLNVPVTGPGVAGQYTGEPGILAYFEYCTNPDWIVVESEDPSYVYAYHDSEWISYDNANTAAAKAKYAVENGLAGVMIYSLESEDFGGNCGSKYPLLTGVNKGLGRLA